MPDPGEPEAMLDRQGLEVLGRDECWALLDQAPVGRIAFVDADGPVILPVTHVVADGVLAFLTASGSKLGAAMMAEPVSFEVDGYDAERHTGWSVVARGVAEPVYEEVLRRRLDATEHQPWAQGASRHHWVQIKVDEVSGRRLTG